MSGQKTVAQQIQASDTGSARGFVMARIYLTATQIFLSSL